MPFLRIFSLAGFTKAHLTFSFFNFGSSAISSLTGIFQSSFAKLELKIKSYHAILAFRATLFISFCLSSLLNILPTVFCK